jgi:hypothetical protein
MKDSDVADDEWHMLLNNNRDDEHDSYGSKRLSCDVVGHHRTACYPLLHVFLHVLSDFSRSRVSHEVSSTRVRVLEREVKLRTKREKKPEPERKEKVQGKVPRVWKDLEKGIAK